MDYQYYIDNYDGPYDDHYLRLLLESPITSATAFGPPPPSHQLQRGVRSAHLPDFHEDVIPEAERSFWAAATEALITSVLSGNADSTQTSPISSQSPSTADFTETSPFPDCYATPSSTLVSSSPEFSFEQSASPPHHGKRSLPSGEAPKSNKKRRGSRKSKPEDQYTGVFSIGGGGTLEDRCKCYPRPTEQLHRHCITVCPDNEEFWEEFECEFCGTTIKGRRDNLRRHQLESCTGIPGGSGSSG